MANSGTRLGARNSGAVSGAEVGERAAKTTKGAGARSTTERQLRDLQDRIRSLGGQAWKLQEALVREQECLELHADFQSRVAEASRMGEKLNNFEVKRDLGSRHPSSATGVAPLARLSFSGYLEGDFAERSYLDMPIILSGGFFLHSHHANIIFDPGMGSLVGMRELGINLPEETDAIFVSHYHPSARFDLHTLLNELGGYCPGRSARDGQEQALERIPLFCSEALYKGRNEHPPALIPSDLRVIEPKVASPGQAWYLRKIGGRVRVEPAGQGSLAEALAVPPCADALLMLTLPAYHSETIPPGKSVDAEGLSGQVLSAVFLETLDYGVLFTGDTQYPQHWDPSILKRLEGKVTVLIANMKTLAYLPQEGQQGQEVVGAAGWYRLPLTKNQLGFEGARRLAEDLQPQVLVLRALGLECVVAEEKGGGTLRYEPERLSIYQRAMLELLGERVKVIIPGRHEILLKAGERGLGGEQGGARIRSPLEIEERAIIPAFPKTGIAAFGSDTRQFITQNQTLAREIQGHIDSLKTARRPYLVIEGESGGGKTQLAHAIAAELIRDTVASRGARLIESFDLATVDSGDSNIYGNILFGWRKGFFHANDAGHNGLLGIQNGVLILNQLEKLPLNESKRFLDVLEEWTYNRRGEENVKLQEVKVKIIFTTNIPLLECTNLAPDMKNRLMIRRATLPPLKSLTKEERSRDLRVFVTHWCRDQGVILEPGILELLADIDLSQGSFRTLRGMLELSRFLALSEFGLQQFAGDAASLNVNVGASFFREAMRRSQVDFIKPRRDISEGVPRRLACLVAIWISHECNNSKTCAQVREGEGASPNAFNEKLMEFRHHFTASESAWAFFQGPETSRELLREGELEAYLDRIGAAPETDFLNKLFKFRDESELRDWIGKRSAELYNILFEPACSTQRSRVRQNFIKRLDGRLGLRRAAG